MEGPCAILCSVFCIDLPPAQKSSEVRGQAIILDFEQTKFLGRMKHLRKIVAAVARQHASHHRGILGELVTDCPADLFLVRLDEALKPRLVLVLGSDGAPSGRDLVPLRPLLDPNDVIAVSLEHLAHARAICPSPTVVTSVILDLEKVPSLMRRQAALRRSCNTIGSLCLVFGIIEAQTASSTEPSNHSTATGSSRYPLRLYAVWR